MVCCGTSVQHYLNVLHHFKVLHKAQIHVFLVADSIVKITAIKLAICIPEKTDELWPVHTYLR